jgi:cell volume regulation protein A
MEALDLLLLAAGLLMFVTLLAGVYSARLGLSFLLVFLVAGMLAGEEGPGGVRFDSPQLAFWVGNAALAVILLEGGASTRVDTVKEGVRPALLLATVGVLVTAAIVGGAAMALLGLDWRHGLLLGAIVGSTDAAAVFSLMRQAGLRLARRTSATLEMESGLNDPMAVFLVLALIASFTHGSGPADLALLFLRQAGFGGLIGLVGGRAAAWLLRRLPVRAEQGGLLSLLIVSGGLALFALAGLVGGSGFLAVYIFGLRLRALSEDAVHAASSALDGFAWAAQATMFLLLGLLVTPHEMLRSAPVALAIAGTLMFVARPVAVWLCLAPMRFTRAERAFIGWVGLRGAVPMVLALFPLLDHLPNSGRFFNIAFAVVLASLLLQGTTLRRAARVLGAAEPPQDLPAEQRPVQGRLTLDGELPVEDVFPFFQLPLPDKGGPTLRDWMTDALAKDHAEGDGVDWHGARFHVAQMHEGRIHRVALSLTRQTVEAQQRGKPHGDGGPA